VPYLLLAPLPGDVTDSSSRDRGDATTPSTRLVLDASVVSRRRFLATTGLLGALAGCLGDDDIEEETYGTWFRGANNFEGTVDRTGTAEAVVTVGAGDGFSFDPAAVRVDVGTTVAWEWTGEGGQHNVVEEDGAFESELYLDPGRRFEHAFEEPGVFRYVCTPHQARGMVGAVHVVGE